MPRFYAIEYNSVCLFDNSQFTTKYGYWSSIFVIVTISYIFGPRKS